MAIPALVGAAFISRPVLHLILVFCCLTQRKGLLADLDE